MVPAWERGDRVQGAGVKIPLLCASAPLLPGIYCDSSASNSAAASTIAPCGLERLKSCHWGS